MFLFVFQLCSLSKYPKLGLIHNNISILECLLVLYTFPSWMLWFNQKIFQCSLLLSVVKSVFNIDTKLSFSYSFLRHLWFAACEKYIKWQFRLKQNSTDNAWQFNQRKSRGTIHGKRWPIEDRCFCGHS